MKVSVPTWKGESSQSNYHFIQKLPQLILPFIRSFIAYLGAFLKHNYFQEFHCDFVLDVKKSMLKILRNFHIKKIELQIQNYELTNCILHSIRGVPHASCLVHERHQPSKQDNGRRYPICRQVVWSTIACLGQSHGLLEISNRTEKYKTKINWNVLSKKNINCKILT